MKYFSLILICILLSTTVSAQKIPYGKSKYYVFFDEDYAELPDKKGATYVRVFLGVDSVKTVYEVRDYTIDGRLLFIAGSSSKDFLKHEGLCTWYNSKRLPLKTGFYVNGGPEGLFTDYYENGQMAVQAKYTEGKRSINNSWDSTGKAEVIDGNGWYKKRDDTTGIIIQTGKVVNGKPDSLWTYFDKKGNKEAEVIFHDAKFVTGTRYDETGKAQTFKDLYTPPEFPGGQLALSRFLGKTVKYPREDLEKGVSGTVVITFMVNEYGKISKIAVHSGVSETLDRESLRVVSAMPDWTSSTQRGKNIPQRFFLPIRFTLQQ